ncbi:hypothetical protein H257_09928 [Aphanomyces astaci]|uniref:Uncharacterized protein n=2 Tax=Aphanomyces astaci TaxID=112090 RepID=W4GA72_APHAT|nr:hypothetical protein H257_09928 [Aphanomyces astaci]ETV75974.1 hypothetical protein H257_09928 [Aphanomyces astaci]|eukprot:XP_009834616.1 hypothetical protein H257_09928 [Aphanomyces astaci]
MPTGNADPHDNTMTRWTSKATSDDAIEPSPPSSSSAPPSDGLASFDLFVQWVLLSPTSTVDAHCASMWPADLDALDDDEVTSREATDGAEFATTTDAKLAQASVEADHEDLADTLFAIEREIDALDEALVSLEHDKTTDELELAQCERHLLQRLKDRDETVADQYALEHQIAQVQQLGSPQDIVSSIITTTPSSSKLLRRGMTRLNLPFGWSSKNQSNPSASLELDIDLYHDTTQVHKDIELYEKRLAHEKLSLAEAKSDLDTQIFSNRLLAKKCAKLQESRKAFLATQIEAKDDLDQMQTAYAATVAKLKMVSNVATTIRKNNATASTPHARAST